MVKISRFLRGQALIGSLAFVASSLTTGAFVQAQAGGTQRIAGPQAQTSAQRLGPIDDSSFGKHDSVITIPDTPGVPIRKGIHIGVGKSVMVEFPRAVKDVMVSDPGAVDVMVMSSNRVFLMARKFNEANVFVFDTKGEQFAVLEIVVERDTSALESIIRRLIPNSNVHVEMINSTVVLSGTVRNPADSNRAQTLAAQFTKASFEFKTAGDADDVHIKDVKKEDHEIVINMIAVEGEEQVMIQVKVAEVERQAMKQLGINLGAQINSGNFSTTLLTDNALPLTAAAGLGTLPAFGISTAIDSSKVCSGGGMCQVNGGPNSITSGNSGLSGGWASSGNQVNHAIRALERDGLIKTLAEPSLTAVSGETAKFLAGGEFPIPTIDTTGALNVIYKEFGVAVAFTPVVMSEGRISLKIETEVSELSNNGAVVLANISIPALKKRTAKSTVELPSGGSIALAGLISDDVRQNIDGFPGLKDVPILGTLFRSRDFIHTETELVVIVTPYLVRPVAAKDLKRPDQGLVTAADREGNLLGHLNRLYPRGTGVRQGSLKDDYGFIVE